MILNRLLHIFNYKLCENLLSDPGQSVCATGEIFLSFVGIRADRSEKASCWKV